VLTCYTDAQCGWEYVCNPATHTCHPPRDCLAVVKVWRGGLAYYGGFIFAAAFGLYYARKHKLGMWKMADLAAPWIALGLASPAWAASSTAAASARSVGCPGLCASPRTAPCTRSRSTAHLIGAHDAACRLHPTQLYLAALNLLTFFLLYFFFRKHKRFHGYLFAWLLICKGVFRSLVEIWRDDDRGASSAGCRPRRSCRAVAGPGDLAALAGAATKRGRRHRAIGGGVRPTLVTLPIGAHGLGVHSYGLAIAVGFAIGVILAAREARRAGLDPGAMLDLLFWILVSGVLGSRLAFVLLQRG
jgi:prolipoprotein diacylglyceryltransferase